MNNIQAKDWAEDDWGGHSGMVSNPYDDDDLMPENKDIEVKSEGGDTLSLTSP